MRILFAGTPEIAVPSLETLSRSFTVCGVLTNPDRRSGRGKKLAVSPVKTKALELGLPVLQPPTLTTPARREVRALEPDLLVAVAYGRIFGPKFMALFPKGGLNLHPSLLPQHRGCAPITAAILDGDTETGITIQKLALEMDSGDILRQQRFPLDGTETTLSLTAYCGKIGAEMLREVISSLIDGKAKAVPQNHPQATYCGMIKKEDGLIDWTQSADTIERMVRAYIPWPTAYTVLDGKRLSLLKAGVVDRNEAAEPGTVLGVDNTGGFLIQTGKKVLAVQELHLATKKAMHWKNFRNGYRDLTGTILGAE